MTLVYCQTYCPNDTWKNPTYTCTQTLTGGPQYTRKTMLFLMKHRLYHWSIFVLLSTKHEKSFGQITLSHAAVPFVIFVMILRTWNCSILESLFFSYTVVLIFSSNYSGLFVSFYHTILSTCSRANFKYFPFKSNEVNHLYIRVFSLTTKTKRSWCPYLSENEIITLHLLF